MLQQILRDMYIDPDLLAELDEEQKQILFVKIREEQVRRWKQREEEYEKENVSKPKKHPKQGAKKVDFLKGRDGSEWVWVMGEHKDDLSIEQILEREAQRKALFQAEEEAAEQRKKKEESVLYQSIHEAKVMVAKMEEEKQQRRQKEQQRLAELSEEQKRLRRRSMEMLDTVKKRRSTEIYSQWKETRQKLEKQAEENSKEVEASWKLQEQKAKEADKEFRELAQRARTDYMESLRRSKIIVGASKAFNGARPLSECKPAIPPKKHLQSNSSSGGGRTKPRPLRPRNRSMVIDWFIREEKAKGVGLDPCTEKVAKWFHGVISRQEAEQLLADKDDGFFLVRVSERVWGYTISYKERHRCKHFLIDSTEQGYQFFGVDQALHKSLAELVQFHKETPITVSGSEKLLYPCGQTSDPPDYWELFQNQQAESTTL
ncbi:SH2 domain-containing protein 4B-like isoform X2 [Pomacea canaliculata]|uniref:SH2 domain-containing protein 4B-like isoform X2 n=1 Tax=Pomacea canaliculata TaxID=400727 RepID=UPI000D73D562|nr:SH2 domain-containing protein 4B-like isoform X2 [Pomacea canaliculata]